MTARGKEDLVPANLLSASEWTTKHPSAVAWPAPFQVPPHLLDDRTVKDADAKATPSPTSAEWPPFPFPFPQTLLSPSSIATPAHLSALSPSSNEWVTSAVSSLQNPGLSRICLIL